MPHYFVDPAKVSNGRFSLNGDEAHHLLRVLRLKPGDEIDLFDGTGRQFHAMIDKAGSGSIEGAVLSQQTASSSLVALHLFCSVPKGDRFDWLVEKSSEIGVLAITPLITSRSSSMEISGAKLERWRRLSLAASKQCGRAGIMEIHPAMNFCEALKTLPPDVVALLPWEGEAVSTIERSLVSAGASAALFIGPEGGFTLQEVEQAKAAKVLPVTLGQSILRVETAALIASVLVLEKAGQFTAHDK
jgi:16S rRNA (uracil1498-N3)-methyltransferase